MPAKQLPPWQPHSLPGVPTVPGQVAAGHDVKGGSPAWTCGRSVAAAAGVAAVSIALGCMSIYSTAGSS